jgi:hypothetical protein
MIQTVDMMRTEEMERLPRDADASFGSLATARGHLPLEAMDVHARAVGLDVRIDLRQTFRNTLAEPIEATYIFPLPDRGAVTGFRLRVGERVVEGVIDERGAAAATTTRRSATAIGRPSPRRSARTCSRCGRKSHAGPGRVDRARPGGRAGAGEERGHLPLPAGGGAALHPGRPAAGRERGRRRGQRHRRGAGRLAHHAAGAPARLSQPGSPQARVDIDPSDCR